jgi:hypothetical protein
VVAPNAAGDQRAAVEHLAAVHEAVADLFMPTSQHRMQPMFFSGVTLFPTK